MKATSTMEKINPLHIVGDDGEPLCAAGRSIDPKHRKTLDTIPPTGRVCKRCKEVHTPTIIIPSIGGVKADGQVLRNHPVPNTLVDPDDLVVGSTQISPKGSKLLMLQLNPVGITWYYATSEQRYKDIEQIRKYKP